MSSKSDALIKARNKKVKYTPLVSTIINENEDISNLPQIKWGTDHESDAIKAFMSDIAPQHVGGMEGFRECGLFVKGDYPFLAGSPDGMFVCKCCSPAAIEAKCPYSVRFEDLHKEEVYRKVEFLEKGSDAKPKLKTTHRYYSQVQAVMWVIGANHCYFIVWTEGHRPLYLRIDFDPVYIQNNSLLQSLRPSMHVRLHRYFPLPTVW